MPTYEYQCDACGHAMEEFQSITANPLRKCPACGKSKLKRLIGTGAGIIFKGQGFWQTDYRSESYKKGAEADTKSAENKTDKKSESKSQSKPAEAGKKSAEKPKEKKKPKD